MPRFHISPATLELHRVGVSVQQIADELGCTRPCVARYLAGRRRPHPDLLPTIRRIAGDQVARKVARYLAGAK